MLTGDCDAGYWCINGSATATPTDGTTGVLCPEGYYCPAGITTPTPCPLGTFSNTSGLIEEPQCTACIGGYYCGSEGLSEPTDLCDAGYVTHV